MCINFAIYSQLDKHLQGSTSRAPSQNPDEVDAFLNQSGGAGGSGQNSNQPIDEP